VTPANTRETGLVPSVRKVVRSIRARLNERKVQRQWIREGRPEPAPPHVKRARLRKYVLESRLPVFLETGTLYGDTLVFLRRYFDELHSIELSEELYRNAVIRFRNDSKIKLWQGDSATVLPRVLEVIERPTLFWLDGHYSGEGTGRGLADTPIQHELTHISRHRLHGQHRIIIDDARCFTGANGYPKKDELRDLIAKLGFRSFEQEGDFFLVR